MLYPANGVAVSWNVKIILSLFLSFARFKPHLPHLPPLDPFTHFTHTPVYQTLYLVYLLACVVWCGVGCCGMGGLLLFSASHSFIPPSPSCTKVHLSLNLCPSETSQPRPDHPTQIVQPDQRHPTTQRKGLMLDYTNPGPATQSATWIPRRGTAIRIYSDTVRRKAVGATVTLAADGAGGALAK